MKKSIPIIRERESEAFILGNGREREFPLTPGALHIVCVIASAMCILCGQSAVVVCSLRQADWQIGVGKVLLGRSFGQPAREVAVVLNIILYYYYYYYDYIIILL